MSYTIHGKYCCNLIVLLTIVNHLLKCHIPFMVSTVATNINKNGTATPEDGVIYHSW